MTAVERTQIATGDGPGGRPLLDEPVEIAVVDYGMGNRRSVEKAFERIGASVTISRSAYAAASRSRKGRPFCIARRGSIS